MRKKVIAQDGKGQEEEGKEVGWLDLEALAQAEVSSEAAGHPVEHALIPGSDGFWQAAVAGPATITLRFDTPQTVSRVLLQVVETEHERNQEWTLGAAFADGSRRELLRQGWNFSPGGSNEQREEYAFDLREVTSLVLMIDADHGRDRYPATLRMWRVGAAG